MVDTEEWYINIQTKEKMCLNKVFEKISESSALIKNPEIWIYWDFKKNTAENKDIKKITKGSSKKAWWICDKCNSSYDMSIKIKVNGSSCPYCRGLRVNETNSIASTNPDLAKEWDLEKNCFNIKPENVSKGSQKKVWWLCGKCNSGYEMVVKDRVSGGQSCPYCRGLKINSTNSLSKINPELSREWNKKRNGSLSPNDVSRSSGRKVWWQCSGGHEWQAKVNTRERGINCPYCSNKKVLVGFNDMWTTNPNLAAKLYNSEDGYTYTEGSSEKVDWCCPTCQNKIKSKSINDFKLKFHCSNCSFSSSYPERVISNLLDGKLVSFHSEKTFNWSNKKRYDFYIEALNMIIEVHGAQHYRDAWDSMDKQRENDILKRDLALSNGIEVYVEIDASVSEIDFLSNSIKNSKLKHFFGFSKDDLNAADKKANESPAKKMVEMREYGMSNEEIAKILKLKEKTIQKRFANIDRYR